MRIKAGDQAPQLVLPSIDGTTFEMSAMKGKRAVSYTHLTLPTILRV